MQRGDNMNELLAIEQSPLVLREISEEVFNSWTSFIDASPRTVETYSKAIKQFFRYLQGKGIKQPQREDIVAYREYLSKDHKPTKETG